MRKPHDDEDEDPGPAISFGPVPNRKFAFFMTEVNQDSIRPLCEWIFASNFDKTETRPEELTIFINSAGGDLHAAYALIDIMQGSTIPVRTVGLGMVASAALLIFMTGAKGTRTLTPNTSILSHQWSAGSIGKAHELAARSKEFDLTQKRIIKHYMKHTGLSESKILKLLLAPHDQWLDCHEALKLGLCDVVQETSTFIPKEVKSKAKSKTRSHKVS